MSLLFVVIFDAPLTKRNLISSLRVTDYWLVADLDKCRIAFLKPNGKFIMADFHPVVWMFDNDFKTVFIIILMWNNH
jgi:hypothetical protein